MAEANITTNARWAHCAACEKKVHRSRTSATVQYCLGCRRQGLAPSRAQHGAGRYRDGCRCDVCRSAVASAARAYRAKRKSDGRPASPYRVASCVTCNETFNARKRDGGFSKNCSLRCANIARNLARGFKPRPPRKSEFRKRAEKLARKAATGTSGGNRVFVQGACIVCSEQFMSPGAASRYCSLVCREKNRAVRSFGLSWLDRMALFEADGWKCQICFEPVDYTADALSDWYPSIDHIIPRAHGGSDDRGNLRTAHRWCNSVRGDLSFYTDADLVA